MTITKTIDKASFDFLSYEKHYVRDLVTTALDHLSLGLLIKGGTFLAPELHTRRDLLGTFGKGHGLVENIPVLKVFVVVGRYVGVEGCDNQEG